jgi:hypothetical protein
MAPSCSFHLDGRTPVPWEERMKRSIRAALGVVIVALAIPAVAYATRHHGPSHSFRHGHHGRYHRASGATGPSGTEAAVVTSYTGGKLTLALTGGGSITGAVTDRTRFVCIRTPQSGGGQHYDTTLRGAVTGVSGPTGDSGVTGVSGPTGNSGPTSDTGQSGASGPTGDPGSTTTSTTGGSGPTGGYGGGYGGHGHHSDRHGYGGSGGGGKYTLPPPCDSSLLIQNAGLLSAAAEFTVNGVLFSEIVLLPAVQ